MAFTLSRFLRLRLDSNLTANARYNLERIDLLGASLSLDNTASISFRSRADINVEPQSQQVGGSGSGGVVNIGSASHQITSFNVFAGTVTGILPSQTGHAGQVLQTDGSLASWQSVSGISGVQSSEGNWITADGTSKLFTHGLNNLDTIVSIKDVDTNQLIGVDSIITNSANSITLVASEAPANSWRITVHAD